jgi:hypothetical protein
MAPIVQSIRKGENLDQPALSSEDEAAIYDLLESGALGKPKAEDRV